MTPPTPAAPAVPTWHPADEHDFAWDVEADALRALLGGPLAG